MKFTSKAAAACLALALSGLAQAQESLPPMQPPLPLAPPPMRQFLAPIILGDSYETRVAIEDVVGALGVRGFEMVRPKSSWDAGPFACLAADRSDFACVQRALIELRDKEPEAQQALLLHGRLQGGSLDWTCVGHAHIVRVQIDLETFFAVDFRQRNDVRNRALACMERAVGVYDWDTPQSVL